jgi:hypothetical protein
MKPNAMLNWILKLTERKSWRIFSLFLALIALGACGATVFCFVTLHRSVMRPQNSAFYRPPLNQRQRSTIKIPVRFLTKKAELADNGALLPGREYRDTSVQVNPDEVALILVDLWDSGTPVKEEDLDPRIVNIRDLLQQCRAFGVTVIHAPNHPVVDQYPQYHTLKFEVRRFLAGEDRPTRAVRRIVSTLGEAAAAPRKTIYDWPPPELYKQYWDIRNDGRYRERQLKKTQPKAISRHLSPLPDEFVLATSDELRYVLWLRGIKVLLYVGGAANECLLQRDTGINALAGTDGARSNYVIVVLSDCLFWMRGTQPDDESALLDYLMWKIAFVSESRKIEWKSEPEAVRQPTPARTGGS